jgi:hypothetical protein
MHWNLELRVLDGSQDTLIFQICATFVFKINQGQSNEHNMHLEQMHKMKDEIFRSSNLQNPDLSY